MVNLRDLLTTSFRELEVILFQTLGEQFLEVLREVLEALDELLSQDRDKERWVMKDARVREIETLFGTVRFKRRYYLDRETGAYVFLLDEALGIAKKSKVSPGLAEAAVWQGVNGPSYRNGQATLEAFYARPVISHETIRQLTLETGELITRETQKKQQEPQGKRRVRILFIEADGLYAHLQRDQADGVEKQIAFSHEGWQRRSTLSDEYELVNRKYRVAAEGEDFWEAASRQIYGDYDLEGAIVVMNGDRAGWIRQGVEYFGNAAVVLYQWDRFHVAKELREILANQPERRRWALRAFEQSDSTRLLAELATAEAHEKVPEQKERIRALKKALLADPEAARDYRVRLQEMGYSTRGLRGLGAAESNMDRFANRLKKRGQNWGRYGLHTLTAALAKHLEGRLRPYAQQVARLKDLAALPRLKQGTAGLARRVIDEVYVPRQGSFPAARMGKQGSSGLNHFFNQLSRPGIELT